MKTLAVIVFLLILLVYYCNKPKSIYDYGYFDWNGTAPPYKEALKTEASWLGNASAFYGDRLEDFIDKTRYDILQLVNLQQGEVIFTSGGSESINTVLRAFKNIVTSELEHKTTLECVKNISHVKVKATADGHIDLTDLENKLNANVDLISLIHVNNETGAILPLDKVRMLIQVKAPNAKFHIDAVQSFGKLFIDGNLVDFISFSGHKFGAMTGVGGLICKTKIAPLIAGSQNDGLRGGTYNLVGITSLYTALQLSMKDRVTKNAKIYEYKQRIVKGLASYPILSYDMFYNKPDDMELPGPLNMAGIVILGGLAPCKFVANTLLIAIVRYGPLSRHFCNLQLRSYLLSKNIVVSTGSACLKGSSHVLTAIKAPYIIRCGVVRISWGDRTSSSEVNTLIKEIKKGIDLQILG
jgi:cysteine desulfurase